MIQLHIQRTQVRIDMDKLLSSLKLVPLLTSTMLILKFSEKFPFSLDFGFFLVFTTLLAIQNVVYFACNIIPINWAAFRTDTCRVRCWSCWGVFIRLFLCIFQWTLAFLAYQFACTGIQVAIDIIICIKSVRNRSLILLCFLISKTIIPNDWLECSCSMFFCWLA